MEQRMASARPTGHRPIGSQVRGANPVSNGEDRQPPAEDRAPFVSLATDLLTVIGPDGCFKRLAPRFPQAFGYIEAELLDQPFLTFIHPADRAATSAALEKLAQGEPTLGLENRFCCKDASYRRLAWLAMPTPEGLLYAVAHDISERTKPQEERARSLAREQTAALAQTGEFLASVCHDVQQPLTVILAQTQLLQRQLARAEMLPSVRLGTGLAQIFAAATRMRGMTQNLLDASLQESGHTLALLLARTELVALARQAVGEHELLSDLHQFLFDAELPTLEATVDETRVHRVLANLLTNAIKYSPNGGAVRVTIKATDGPDGKSAVLVVRDEGVGIPQDDLPYVFNRFHRGANVVGRFAGTGLGLASARELVELHGGTISVESEEGKGSTFVVRLPLTPQEARGGIRAAAGQWPMATDALEVGRGGRARRDIMDPPADGGAIMPGEGGQRVCVGPTALSA
jgi:PAS domain S-box-containing protein